MNSHYKKNVQHHISNPTLKPIGIHVGTFLVMVTLIMDLDKIKIYFGLDFVLIEWKSLNYFFAQKDFEP
jgi:hypothetical protein